MKPIKIKNEEGEPIEIKFDADGRIKIRHSDIDAKSWGKLHEYAKRMKVPKLKSLAAGNEIDLDSPEAKIVAEMLGGYMVLRGKTYMIGAQELSLIKEAVKQAGGIIPNWSSHA